MPLRIIEDSERFTFEDALELKIWLESFEESELFSLPILHGESDHLTLVYETEVLSNGERVKNIVIEGPADPQEPESEPISKPKPVKACKECGSTNIFYDATADQNGDVITVHDNTTCGGCELESPEQVEVSP